MPSAVPMAIGMNLDNVNDYTPNWQFSDAFQSSRPWISHSYNTVTRTQDWNGGVFVPVQTDASGWPTQLATWSNAHGHLMQQRLGTLMFNNLNGAYPSGTYRVEWEGTGNVVFGNDARELSRGRTADGRNFALLNVVARNDGIYLGINSSGVSDPIRNIHVWMPDYNGQNFTGQVWQPPTNGQPSTFSPFHPLYRERLNDFGIIRFMQAQETNTSDIRTWTDRRDANDARQNSGNGGNGFVNGISVEHMVQLANEVDADPWFNMPHMADDSFVRNFATYVRDNLEPGLTAYVEWSNEIWNSAPGYEPYFWIADQTRRPENAGMSHWQIAGREAARDMNIWSDVFAGQTGRIVRVAGGQATTPWVSERIIENMGGSFDAIAIAPYFGPNETQRSTYSATTTVDQVLNDLRGNIVFGAQMAVGHQRLADDYSTRLGRDIQLLAYEGGQHLNGRGSSYQEVLFAATKDPRMADITRDYLRIQNAAGLDAYVHYKLTDRNVATQWGNFGVLNQLDQPLSEAHVYRTLLDAASGNLFTTGPTLVTLNAADPQAHEAGLGTASFRVTRGGDLSQPLTVNYSVGGTATPGSDYNPLSGTVTFAANDNTAIITITPRDDLAIEANETVTISLQPGASYNIISTATSSDSISLISNDLAANLPTIQITATDANASEANRDPGVFMVTRVGGNTATSLTVYLRAGFQTASSTDYDPVPQVITFAPGQTTVTVTVRPVDDTTVENAETVVMFVQPQTSYLVGPGAEARITITDNDVAPPPVTPRVTVAATDAQANEVGNNNGVFTLTRTGNLNNSLLVRYTASGTATGGADYAALSGFAFFASGATMTNVTVVPINDPASEIVETIILNITDGESYDPGAVSSATVQIVSDEAPILPTVTLSTTDAVAAELNRDPATFTVSRTGSTAAALVVNYTLSGTATNGADYDWLGGSVIIPAGASSATIMLRPIDDSTVDANETAIVNLSGNESYTLGTTTIGTATIADNDVAPPLPVLIVIGNNDFYYTEYSAPRAALEAAGIPVVVGAGRRAWSVPHANTGYTSGNGAVMPDIALADARASDYSAILFVGGWGAAQYQYAFPGTYSNSAYNGTPEIRAAANRLINEFVAQEKIVTGVCYGVSVLAWSRVNGQSLLQGRTATTAHFNSPTNNLPEARLYRWHLETNGATAFTGGTLGDLNSRFDDVLVDGRIVTADNFDSARLLGETLADRLLRRNQPVVTMSATDPGAFEPTRDIGVLTATRTGTISAALAVNYSLSGTAVNGSDYEVLRGTVVIHPGQTAANIIVRPVADAVAEPVETVVATMVPGTAYTAGSSTAGTVVIADSAAQAPRPVLMVIANSDFHYQEYADPRARLEAAGIRVVVAAARRELSTPQTNSGQGTGSGSVMPDIALADVNASDYSAIVFVGGWGASMYQYAFGGTYSNTNYNGTQDLRLRVNQVINDFVAQGKYVTALSHGVSVLAWARVNNDSLLSGRRVSTLGTASPPSTIVGAQLSRWHSDTNGATVFTNGQIGDPGTTADDVIVDGRIITAENYDSARQFGVVLANHLLPQ